LISLRSICASRSNCVLILREASSRLTANCGGKGIGCLRQPFRSYCFQQSGGKGIRTPGLLIANETLYQLSYTPVGTVGNYAPRGVFGKPRAGRFHQAQPRTPPAAYARTSTQSPVAPGTQSGPKISKRADHRTSRNAISAASGGPSCPRSPRRRSSHRQTGTAHGMSNRSLNHQERKPSGPAKGFTSQRLTA
jgi:hypothetical protein